MKNTRRISSVLLCLLLALTLAPISWANADMNTDIDVIICIDASSYMKKSDPAEIAISACKLYTDMCTKSSRVGMVLYTGTASEDENAVLPLTETTTDAIRESIKEFADGIRYNGNADISLGLTTAKSLLVEGGALEENRNPMILLFSDGKDNIIYPERKIALEAGELDNTLQFLKDNSIPVYVIGFNGNGDADEEKLQYIANITGGNYHLAKAADNLPEILNEIYAFQTGGNVKTSAKLSLSSDKVLYTSGEAVKLTVAATDADGNDVGIALFDGATGNAILRNNDTGEKTELDLSLNGSVMTASLPVVDAGRYTAEAQIVGKDSSYSMSAESIFFTVEATAIDDSIKIIKESASVELTAPFLFLRANTEGEVDMRELFSWDSSTAVSFTCETTKDEKIISHELDESAKALKIRAVKVGSETATVYIQSASGQKLAAQITVSVNFGWIYIIIGIIGLIILVALYVLIIVLPARGRRQSSSIVTPKFSANWSKADGIQYPANSKRVNSVNRRYQSFDQRGFFGSGEDDFGSDFPDGF